MLNAMQYAVVRGWLVLFFSGTLAGDAFASDFLERSGPVFCVVLCGLYALVSQTCMELIDVVGDWFYRLCWPDSGLAGAGEGQ